MVERVYMGNDWRADHSFRIPRPDLAAETGAPDACTTCHQDRDPDWAAAAIAGWYPDPKNRGPHYGQVLARGQSDPVAFSGDLGDLALSADQPGIVRATALWLLEAAQSPSAADRVASLLDDPDPLVRAAAVRVQRAANPQDRVLRVIELLDDPVRNVRIEAARAMVGAPVARLPAQTDRDLRAAYGEWQSAMANRTDFPETHLVFGGLALTMRNIPAAQEAFGRVTELDPQMLDAWVMQVRIALAAEDPAGAREILRAALAANPDAPVLLGMASDLGMPPPAD
jgi:hypothetical protein